MLRLTNVIPDQATSARRDGLYYLTKAERCLRRNIYPNRDFMERQGTREL